MDYKEYSVRYLLDEDEISQLERITKLYNNIANFSATPERVFDTIMCTGSKERVHRQLDFFESYFEQLKAE